MIKNKLSCQICAGDVSSEYFAFPKLPSESKFGFLNGLVHIQCLKSHPDRLAIQDELKSIYLQIFGNNHDFPIVACDGYILVKSRPDCQLFEVYDFEDFVEFYIPYNQIDNILELKRNEKIEIGAHQWTVLIVEKNGLITIRQYRSRTTSDEVKLIGLDLDRLYKIFLSAKLAANKLGHIQTS
jgi:hypothetical protein